MPANLTAEAKAKWARAEAVKNPEEKIEALEEFLSAVPKHKGNERLRAQVKRKIAILKDRLEAAKKKGAARATTKLFEKAGAAQVVIIGLANVGKSTLLRAVTNARPAVAEYPYTTTEPTPGMMPFEDIQFQLVELPAASLDGPHISPEALEFIRRADGLIIMVDLSSGPQWQLSTMLQRLDDASVALKQLQSKVEIIRQKGLGGVKAVISGNLVDCTLEDVMRLLQSYKIRDVLVRAYGRIGMTDIEDAIFENNYVYKPAMVLANKADLVSDDCGLDELIDISAHLPVVKVSCLAKTGLEELGKRLMDRLQIIRIYTKDPKAPAPSKEPFFLRRGSSVGDLAKSIHPELFERFSFSRMWRRDAGLSGRRVGLNQPLEDGDVVEIHTR